MASSIGSRGCAAWLLVALGGACASNVVAVQERVVRDELQLLTWRAATGGDLVGQWRARSMQGPAAAVLMDLAYYLEADGRFTGAALFVGPPPTYEVLSGTWTLTADGSLQLGADAAPARVETAQGFLRLTGAEGSLVLERAEIR